LAQSADISPDEVLAAQEKHKGESDYQIFALSIDLKRIYLWKHDDEKAAETQEKIDEYYRKQAGGD
jgi:hypothetical protein